VHSRNFVVVQLGRLDSEACRDVKLHKWSSERKDGVVHLHFLHPLDQPFRVKERAIERILQLPDIEGDRLARCRVAMHEIGRGLFNKPHEWFGHMVDVNVRDHALQPQRPR